MKRADAVSYMRIAGYHSDRAAFTRLLIENRVSYKAAHEAYRIGVEQRAGGVTCSCHECKVSP